MLDNTLLFFFNGESVSETGKLYKPFFIAKYWTFIPHKVLLTSVKSFSVQNCHELISLAKYWLAVGFPIDRI